MNHAVPGSRYCLKHKREKSNGRKSAAKRGYDWRWRKIRERVLMMAGIPKEQWPLWDVDHNPLYNPAVEPDHTKYQLIPRLHADHSRKTVQHDGGFGNGRL